MISQIEKTTNAERFFKLMVETQALVWNSKPECPGRDVANIVTKTIIVPKSELQPDVAWEVKFPYKAIEKNEVMESIITYRHFYGKPETHVFGKFSNKFHPKENDPLIVYIWVCQEDDVKKLIFINELPNALAMETHYYFFDYKGEVTKRDRISDFYSYKNKRWTTSLKATEYPHQVK
jgi:hypothetical protein